MTQISKEHHDLLVNPHRYSKSRTGNKWQEWKQGLCALSLYARRTSRELEGHNEKYSCGMQMRMHKL